MIGRVTRHMLPHLPGVPHLHVNRPLKGVLTLHFNLQVSTRQAKIKQSDKSKPRIKSNHNIYNHYTHYNYNKVKLIPRNFPSCMIKMHLYVQITLPDIFYFFHSWKEGRGGRTLKGKEKYVKGKATKRCKKDAFHHCKQKHSQLMLRWPFKSFKLF